MSKNKSKLSDRGQFFTVVFYCQLDELKRAIARAEQYAFIFHDKDEEDYHYHLLLRYTYQRTVSAVMRDFVSYSNVFVEVLRDIQGSLDYLTHANDPEKYQYSTERIIYSEFGYWDRLFFGQKNKKADEMEEFVDDLILYARDKISNREMAIKYGRDFIRNRCSYYEFGVLVHNDSKKYGRKV